MRKDRSGGGRPEAAGHERHRRPEPTGRSASRHVPGPCSARTTDAERWFRDGDRPSRAERACEPSSPARISCMANGCGARAAGSTRAPSSTLAHELFTSMGMEAFAERARQRAPRDGREGPQADRRRPATISPRRSGRSPSSPAMGSRTRRSAPACSSAGAPSSGTCATCSPSSGSDPDASSEGALQASDSEVPAT